MHRIMGHFSVSHLTFKDHGRHHSASFLKTPPTSKKKTADLACDGVQLRISEGTGAGACIAPVRDPST